MKNLLKKILLSVLLQCMFVFCYLLAVLMYSFYVWEINEWIFRMISWGLNILIQFTVYKIYKKKPLENEKHKDIYMWVNGLFIVFEVWLLTIM